MQLINTAIDTDVVPGDASVLPSNPSFAGHATFAVRSGWLKKGLDAIVAPNGSQVFTQPDALVVLGVGKNMVGAIRHWILTTRMAVEDSRSRALRPTALGRALFLGDKSAQPRPMPAWDAFLEDEASLWLLHWQLCGVGSLAFTWAYTFNHFRDWEFSKETLIDAVLSATNGRVAKSVSRETIARDVQCLLQTYVSYERGVLSEDNLDCPLRALGLLRASVEGHFRFAIGAKPGLPREVFFYALTRFWMARHPQARTVSVWEICYAEGSPGLVFKLDENSVLDYLDALEGATQGTLRFEDTPLVRQVVLREAARLVPETFLHDFYESQLREGVRV